MDIGSVVNIKIHFRDSNGFNSPYGEDRTCIILGIKYYYELYETWTNKLLYLRYCYGRIYIVAGGPSPPPDFQELHSNPMFYELMYGDKRFWVRGDILEKSCNKRT